MDRRRYLESLHARPPPARPGPELRRAGVAPRRSPRAPTTIAYARARRDAGFECGDAHRAAGPQRRGPGQVALAVDARRRASANPRRTSAVLALAGGPGQAALPLAEDFAAVLGAGLPDRDLLVFDQRGTGASGAAAVHCARCPAARAARSPPTRSAAPPRSGRHAALYTTSQSVDDIEAIRQAAGYDKLMIYGVSYGTKVAADVRRALPEPRRGPDPRLGRPPRRARSVPSLDVRRHAARPDASCARAGDCRAITSDPTGELARMVTGLAQAPAARQRRQRPRPSPSSVSMSDLVMLQVTARPAT